MKKMVLVFAHPDDESLTVGGTVSKYRANGWDIELVCATRGEAGNRGPLDQSPESTGDLRQRELEKAIKILGIRRITFLGYKDGLLSKLASGELEETIYKTLMDRKPDVVITFEPNGISNHPDRKRLAIATTFAFQKYSRSLLVPEKLLKKLNGRSDIPKKYVQNIKNSDVPKLYYICLPKSVVIHLQQSKVLPRTSFGEPMRGIPDEKITTIIDISRFAQNKAHALFVYQTQKKDVDPFLSMPANPLAKHEYFMLRMVGIHEYFMGNNDRVSSRL